MNSIQVKLELHFLGACVCIGQIWMMLGSIHVSARRRTYKPTFLILLQLVDYLLTHAYIHVLSRDGGEARRVGGSLEHRVLYLLIPAAWYLHVRSYSIEPSRRGITCKPNVIRLTYMRAQFTLCTSWYAHRKGNVHMHAQEVMYVSKSRVYTVK